MDSHGPERMVEMVTATQRVTGLRGYRVGGPPRARGSDGDAQRYVAVCGGDVAAVPGVVEHGLFIGLVHVAIIAGIEGVRVVEL
jgi:hypothetical protein